MLMKQISVFIENKSGRLADVAKTLGDNNIDIAALSIADTIDFGILRLIVDKPLDAQKVLEENNFTVKITEVIAMCVEHKPGGLSEALNILNNNGISIEYMYAFVNEYRNGAAIIIRVEDNARAIKVLNDNNIKLLERVA